MRIVVKFPTRGIRKERATFAFGKMLALESALHEVRYVVVRDADDAEWAPLEAALFSLAGAHNAMGRIELHSIAAGLGKIAACNAGTPPPSEWDVLVMGSDDMIPAVDGWDDVIARDMAECWPNCDGCLWYHDGNQARLCTYPIMGVNWYAKAGSVYHGGYMSLFADDDAMAQAQRVGRMGVRLWTVLFKHEHPAYGGAPIDALYERNEARDLRMHDQGVFLMRQARDFDWPAVRLSILICTVHSRAASLRGLLESLNAQINGMPSQQGRMVEIHVASDAGVRGGGASIGAKRQQLLARSIGEYVAFIDDDDAVATDYVPRVLAALESGPDCVGFTLRRMVPKTLCRPGDDGGLYVHSRSCAEASGLARPINHLNPVRRALALRAGYADESWGEDAAYARRLYPLLGSEKFLEGSPAYFYFDDARSSLARPLRPRPAVQARSPDG